MPSHKYAVVFVLAALSTQPRDARAFQQQTAPGVLSEVTIIRQTEALEARGDLAGAEALVRDQLSRSPTSLTSLLTLERLLTMQGKLPLLEPFVERLLQVDNTSVIGHQMRVRLLSTINRPADLERAANAWIAAMPDVETPYREVARAYRARGDFESAAKALDQGRRKLGGDALALELGDAYAELKDFDRAVIEWSRGIGKDGQGLLLVQRRLQSMPDGGVAAIAKLVAALRRDPTTLDRRRAAAQIALDAGLSSEADQLSRQVYRELPSKEKAQFLIDVARRADGGGMPALAYWAYGEAVRIDADTSRALALRSRYAQLAVAVGDTAKATKIYAELEKAAGSGSPQRRQALAARIELGASRGDLTHALADLEMLRKEFPQADEIDEAAAALGTALLEKGNLVGAEAAVAGVTGARAGALRGRIYLRRGDVDKARTALLEAAPLLNGAEATDALTLATLVLRMSNAGGELIGRAMGIASDDADAAVRLLSDSSSRLDPSERASILDYAAVLADRAGLTQRAELVRREIVAKYPQSSATPSALVALAQSIITNGGSKDEARAFLEKLIIDYPRSALVPQARRDLDRLMGRVLF